MDAREVLADVARCGGFFVVDTDPAQAVDPTWRPLRALYGDPRPLRDRIAHAGRVLGCDDRVAASIAFQGLASSLVSAPFAAVVLHGVLPDLNARALHWRPCASGPWPLWCADPVLRDPAGLAVALVEEHLRPLVAAVRAQVSVSEKILWGNVASSIAGAKRLLGRRAPERATEVAAQLLGSGPLAGTGELLPPGSPDHGWTFRRRSCCLYYRVPGGGLCGDCVLGRRPAGSDG